MSAQATKRNASERLSVTGLRFLRHVLLWVMRKLAERPLEITLH